MPEYRRFRLMGGTYFFTLVTFSRRPLFTNPDARQLLHSIWQAVQQKHPFYLDAVCLLPDHLHCIWTLPEGDDDNALRWKEIKRQFSHQYLDRIESTRSVNTSRIKRGEVTVWQRRYWEHLIRNEEDLNQHIDYIHYNPVKHGLVDRVQDWPWSSFHRLVEKGYYEIGWGNERMGDIRPLAGVEVE